MFTQIHNKKNLSFNSIKYYLCLFEIKFQGQNKIAIRTFISELTL
jgi:hypothetical protein